MQSTRMLAAVWLLLAVPPLSLAQSSLQLPSGEEDYRVLLEEQRSGPCERCGVVTGIRTQNHEPARSRNPAAVSQDEMSGMGGSLTTTPIIGSGSSVRDARKAGAPLVSYVITVRYDDGSYAFIEQADEPVPRKGDRVQVIDGRVELRKD